MDTIFLPLIAQDDFESFLRLKISGFPADYATVRQRHLNRLAHYGSTYRVVEVHVDPDEFSRFVSDRAKANDIGSLLAFAEAKGKGEL